MAGAPSISCKTCDSGTLVPRKTYRLSGPAVVIGYLFLVPSVFGFLVAGLLLLGAGGAAAVTTDAVSETSLRNLRAQAVPETVIEAIIAGRQRNEIDRASLTTAQRSAVNDAIVERDAMTVGAGAAAFGFGFLSISLFVSSLMGGLLGWILVMKKRVLKCTSCGAVVAAQ